MLQSLGEKFHFKKTPHCHGEQPKYEVGSGMDRVRLRDTEREIYVSYP
jgi:hypothetical protein